jgi:hypothetical protein
VSVIDALVILNEVVPSTQFLTAINGSAAAKAALEKPGSKTIIAPSDAAVGSTTLGTLADDDVLLGHVFEGNLTSSVLLDEDVKEIVALNGEKYTVSTSTVARRGRREVTLIRIANNRSSVILTVLDIPAEGGVVHSADGVLLSDSSVDNNSSNKSASAEWSNAVYWLYACAVLLVLLIVAVAVAMRRSRRLSKASLADDEVYKLPPDFAAVDWGPEQNDAYAPRGPTSHFYPDDTDWGAAPSGASPVPIVPAQPRHFYPETADWGAAPTWDAFAPRQSANPSTPTHHFYPELKLSSRGQSNAFNLNTPQHPSIRGGHRGRPDDLRLAYMDPSFK